MRLAENQKRLLLHFGLFLTPLTLTLISLYLAFLCATTDFQLRSLPITASLFLAALLTLIFFLGAVFCSIVAVIIFFTHLLPYPLDEEEK